MIIFDGITTASHTEILISEQVQALAAFGKEVVIGAVVFREDAGSQLYTRLKSEAAAGVGIQYHAEQFSITDSLSEIVARIQAFNSDSKITGIIIQKPTKKIWYTAQVANGVQEFQLDQKGFDTWWKTLTSAIALKKDVDGLHPQTLSAIEQNTWQEKGCVLPATCQAVVAILDGHINLLQQAKVVIIGKSDLLGIPLCFVLKNRGVAVELLRKVDLEGRMKNGQMLLDADVIVSATGVEKLITGEMIKEGAVVIDVGEPRPDVDFESVATKACFITPVPGGVGPMTVVSLLANAVRLAQFQK